MVTFDWHAQLTQLINYLRTQREILLADWRARCQQSGVTGPFQDGPTGQILFDTLTHRLVNRLPPDHAQPTVPPGFTNVPASQSVLEGLNSLRFFCTVLDEALQQFLLTYPTTPAPVMAYALRQLMYLATDSTLISGELLAQEQQAPTRPVQQQSPQYIAQTRLLSHDIRATLGILTGATALLQQTSPSEEQGLYVDMLDRNLQQLDQQVDGLMTLFMPTGT